MVLATAKYFVFLEICDADICELLNNLRAIFNQRAFKSNIHVTLRGPYVKPVPASHLEDWYDKISSDSILIANAGMFENDNESIVYLGVSTTHNSRNISRITKKFDYPKNKFDFNPHITLYAGTNKELARKILEFLRKERIELLCHSFELSVYATSSQHELFKEDRPSLKGSISSLISSRKVSPDIFIRARNLVQESSGSDFILDKDNYFRE